MMFIKGECKVGEKEWVDDCVERTGNEAKLVEAGWCRACPVQWGYLEPKGGRLEFWREGSRRIHPGYLDAHRGTIRVEPGARKEGQIVLLS